MKTTKHPIIQDKTETLLEFFKSTDFSLSIMIGFALLTPIVLGAYFDMLDLGIAISIGALLASPSDVSGDIRLKLTGIFLATILATVVTLIGVHMPTTPLLFYPLMGLIIFGVSYLAIFGFRASLISFSGVFALILSFSNMNSEMVPPYVHALLIGLGGLWYMLMALIYHLIFRKTPTDEALANTLKLTGDYLKIRQKLIDKNQDRRQLSQQLLQLQVLLTENHEKLRELLISNRKDSGKSSYQMRRLLIFTELVDVLELAIANPVNYNRTDAFFKDNPEQYEDFKQLLGAMSAQLHEIAKHLTHPDKIEEADEMVVLLEKLDSDIDACQKRMGFNEDLLILRNFYKYQSHQVDKIKKIIWLLKNDGLRELVQMRKKDLRRFVSKPNYDWNLLLENFNFNSAIFRHSLRIAVIMIVGFAIGNWFDLQNAYWILLTIAVIMRPTYGLTKARSKQRIVGTLIGGAVAIAILFLVHNTTIFAILGIISLVISFAMLHKNYKSSAAFITISVIFVYALIEPNVYEVIQFRVMDTIIGTGLAALGNLVLWPAWEINNLDATLLKTIQANRNYLKEVALYYNQRGQATPAYRLARKRAFLATSDLSSSFQRMAQEPKWQRKNLADIYEVAMLNHSFLVAVASLGTYTLNNPTTPASKNFNRFVEHIHENLKLAEDFLTNQLADRPQQLSAQEVLELTYGQDFHQQINWENQTAETIEEAHLVVEQLKWMLEISQKTLKILWKIDFD